MPVPAGPMPNVIVFSADRIHVPLLACGLRAHALAPAHDFGVEDRGRALVGLQHLDAPTHVLPIQLVALLDEHDELLEEEGDAISVRSLARDGDLISPHENLHRERVFDHPQELVALAEQVHHEVVPRNEDLDLGRRRGGHVPLRVAPDDRERRGFRYAEVVAGAQAELVEPHTEVVGPAAEHRREHAQVVAPDRQQATVEVLALELDRRGVA